MLSFFLVSLPHFDVRENQQQGLIDLSEGEGGVGVEVLNSADALSVDKLGEGVLGVVVVVGVHPERRLLVKVVESHHRLKSSTLHARPLQNLGFSVELLQEVQVRDKGKPEVLTVSKVPGRLLRFLHFRIVLVKNDHSGQQLGILEETAQTLVSPFEKVRHLPHLRANFQKVVQLLLRGERL